MVRELRWLKKNDPRAYKSYHGTNAKTNEINAKFHEATSGVLG